MNEGRGTIRGQEVNGNNSHSRHSWPCEAKPGRGCGINHLKRISYTEVIKNVGAGVGQGAGCTHIIPELGWLAQEDQEFSTIWDWRYRSEVKYAM